MRFGGLDGLLREEVALESQRGLAAHQRERVRQREQDHVVAGLRPLKKGASVVDVGAHPRILVGVIRMQPSTEPVQDRVDLDGVHVLRALAQGHGHVVPRPGSDDQHVPK